MTERGLEEREYTQKIAAMWRENPLYETDFSIPLSQTLEGIRNDISGIRGKLTDIGRAFPVWDDRLSELRGAMTCSLIAMAYYRDEMKAWEDKFFKDTNGVPPK